MVRGYCVRERRKTDNVLGSVVRKIASNGRVYQVSICNSCGGKKSSFLPSSPDTRGGKIDIHKLIGKLHKHKKGFVPPGYKYLGHYNPLNKQLKYNKKTGKILE